MEKLLSVAIPCYNVEQYLHKCLTSFSDDRLKETLEVLIVNDGSSDRTVEIAQEYVDRYPDIFILINKENGGHGSAVNAGLDHATGKYFRVVDGDDWVLTDNLVTLMGILDQTDADLVVDERRQVHMVTGETHFDALPSSVPLDREMSFAEICMTPDLPDCLMMHSMSARTSLLKEKGIRLREHIFYVDYEFIVKVTCSVSTVLFTDLEIYQYLIGNANQSVATQNYVKRYDHHDQVVKELLRYSGKAGVSGSVEQYMKWRIRLVIHTQYKIALIYDEDRKRGKQRAEQFREYLKKNYPEYESLTKKRYHQAMMMHRAGFDADKLEHFMNKRK